MSRVVVLPTLPVTDYGEWNGREASSGNGSNLSDQPALVGAPDLRLLSR